MSGLRASSGLTGRVAAVAALVLVIVLAGAMAALISPAARTTPTTYPALRAALDAVSTKVQIQLLSADYYHGAFNSLSLVQTQSSKGRTIGLSKASLAGEFASYRAYELHEERNLGSLEVGKLADFIVLDRNLFKIPPQQIAAVKVLLTVVGGRVVYQGTANEGTT
ncbi:MAG TPA: amidohydrolase family protein [Steroidobacteraceae bacterium]|nr:amidohydrolase family protein [Steroidobacteraceae bacterium]